jgi:hypothetical protein
VATFLSTFAIVAAGQGEGRVYQSNPDLSFLCSFEAGESPLAVLPSTGSDFAVFSAGGEFDVYRFPLA